MTIVLDRSTIQDNMQGQVRIALLFILFFVVEFRELLAELGLTKEDFDLWSVSRSREGR